MKILSKFSIFIIGILVIAFVSFGIVVYSSPSTISNQNERIYLHTPQSYDSNFEGYVKISDMKPNSAGLFMYPSSISYGDRANAYQTFMLIRLPETMGGNKSDVSSFRAYSALDPTSHCLMKYWPQDGRQRIEDPCISQPYRAMDGLSYDPGLTMIRAPTTGALPKLDLDVDSQGYLVVKPPTWTQDKNGAIGIGRDISKDEMLQSSQVILNNCKNKVNFAKLPLELQTGDVLIDIHCSGNQISVFYTNIDDPFKSAHMDAVFCNCTKTPQELGPWKTSENGQFWKIGNYTLYVSGTALQTESKIDSRFSNYVFTFIKNGYEIHFTDNRSFEVVAKEVLQDFFDNATVADLRNFE